jgi:CheY-like chemotaxis protein
LLNLATNARDAMPEGGQLIIKTGVVHVDDSYAETHLFMKTGDHAVLTVSDTGTGMDLKIRESIFEPFFTTKEVGKGTGLGLAMVYGIIKQHDGNIHVSSEPGKGTTFSIYLPIVRAGTEERKKPVTSVPLGKGETILIAEDDIQLRKIARIILKESGYHIIEAENGAEAVSKFKENADKVSLLLLDVIMPGKNGRVVFDEIKKLNPDIKALFISGYTDEIIAKKGILDEGFDFVSKPINLDTMLRKIRDVLDR